MTILEDENIKDEPMGMLVKRMQDEAMDPAKLYPGIGPEGEQLYWLKYDVFQLFLEAFDLGYRSAVEGRDIDQVEGEIANDWIELVKEELTKRGLYNRPK